MIDMDVVATDDTEAKEALIQKIRRISRSGIDLNRQINETMEFLDGVIEETASMKAWLGCLQQFPKRMESSKRFELDMAISEYEEFLSDIYDAVMITNIEMMRAAAARMQVPKEKEPWEEEDKTAV